MKGRAKPRVTLNEVLDFSEACIFLAVARVLLVFLPFKRILPFLGKQRTPAADESGPVQAGPSATRISQALRRGSSYTFWRTLCFEQAIAARLMLKRRKAPCRIFFGVCKDETGDLKAHAWTSSRGAVVTGGGNLGRYTLLSVFEG